MGRKKLLLNPDEIELRRERKRSQDRERELTRVRLPRKLHRPKVPKWRGQMFHRSRVVIGASRLNALPEYGSAAEFAYILSVTPKTLTDWMSTGMPYIADPDKQHYCRRTLKAADVVAWLQETGRAKREYE